MANPTKLRQGGLLATAGTVGFLLGLLFARKPGSELRKDTGDRLVNLQTQVAEKVGLPLANTTSAFKEKARGALSRLRPGKAEENESSSVDVSDLLKPKRDKSLDALAASEAQGNPLTSMKPAGLREFYKQRRMQVPGKQPHPRKLFGG